MLIFLSMGCITMAKNDSLKSYKKKRDFTKTPEPAGIKNSKKKTEKPLFVIQKHAASRLHYDFRLEIDDVLVSWAVPKGPSTDPREKRLAIRTEDHPMDYVDFEGVIPEGQYGGGTVMIWDYGTYKNIKKKGGKLVPMEQCLKDGQIEVWLYGKKLQGGYALHLFKKEHDQWLLVKMKDEKVNLYILAFISAVNIFADSSNGKLNGASNGQQVNIEAQKKMFDYIIDTYFYLIDNPEEVTKKDYANIKSALTDFIKDGANINLGRPVYAKNGKFLGYGPPLLFIAIQNGYKKIVAAILEFDPDLSATFESNHVKNGKKIIENKNLDYYINKSGNYKADFEKVFKNAANKTLNKAEKRKLIADLLK